MANLVMAILSSSSLMWLGALAIGVSLGLLGSGGSTLTVPILVYVVGEPEKVAIASSLAIVGSISFVGAVPYALAGRVNWRAVAGFGVPAMVGSYLGAALSSYLTGNVQMLIFAAIMLAAAGSMLRSPNLPLPEIPPHPALWKMASQGFAIGMVSGVVGVGGGFLIVPALALLLALPFQVAVGTSLLIIALQSALGLYKLLHVLAAHNLAMNWHIVLVFALIGIAGSFVGNRFAIRLPQARLKKMFAGLLLFMGGLIILQHIFLFA